MKAARVHQTGPPGVIAIEDVPIPVPGAGEALVRVRAAGVGNWDALIRSGRVVEPLPLTLGAELAGTVESLGSGDADLAPGDPVYGATNEDFIGAHAEYAIASCERLAHAPTSLDYVQVASIPVVAVTAWQLLENARVTSGQSVLVHGASGNVGAYVVQLAKRIGAHVIATIHSDDAGYVRDLGADEIIDARTSAFETVAGMVDVVVDLVGGSTQRRSFAVVRPGGCLISPVSAPDEDEARTRDIQASYLLVDVTRPYLNRVTEMIDRGDLRTCVGAILPLAEARLAHEMLAGTLAHPRGKIVLQT